MRAKPRIQPREEKFRCPPLLGHDQTVTMSPTRDGISTSQRSPSLPSSLHFGPFVHTAEVEVVYASNAKFGDNRVPPPERDGRPPFKPDGLPLHTAPGKGMPTPSSTPAAPAPVAASSVAVPVVAAPAASSSKDAPAPPVVPKAPVEPNKVGWPSNSLLARHAQGMRGCISPRCAPARRADAFGALARPVSTLDAACC